MAILIPIKLMFYRIFTILVLHSCGEYVLIPRFMFKTKYAKIWLQLVHSFVYTLPFCLYFTINWKILLLFVIHFILYLLRDRFDNFRFPVDQLILIMVACCIYHI